jgi:hypothetical protein
LNDYAISGSMNLTFNMSYASSQSYVGMLTNIFNSSNDATTMIQNVTNTAGLNITSKNKVNVGLICQIVNLDVMISYYQFSGVVVVYSSGNSASSTESLFVNQITGG